MMNTPTEYKTPIDDSENLVQVEHIPVESVSVSTENDLNSKYRRSRTKRKKTGLKTKIIAAVVGIVAVCGAVAGVFLIANVMNSRTVSYEEAERVFLSGITFDDGATSLFDSFTLPEGGTVSVSYTPEEYLLNLWREQGIIGNGEQVTPSTFSLGVRSNDDGTFADIAYNNGREDIISGKAWLDSDDLIAHIPQISNKYLWLELSSLFDELGIDNLSLNSSNKTKFQTLGGVDVPDKMLLIPSSEDEPKIQPLGVSFEAVNSLISILLNPPNKEEIQPIMDALLDGYFEVIGDAHTQVDVTLGDVTVTTQKTEVRLDLRDFCNIALEFLDNVDEDDIDKLMPLLAMLGGRTTEEAPKANEILNEAKREIRAALDDIRVGNVRNGEFLTMDVYVSGKKIDKRDITLCTPGFGFTLTLSYTNVSNRRNYAQEISLYSPYTGEHFKLTNNGKIKLITATATGKADISIGVDNVQIKAEYELKFNTKRQIVGGEATVEAAVWLDRESGFHDVSANANFAKHGFTLGVSVDGMKAVASEVSWQKGISAKKPNPNRVDTLKIPDDIDAATNSANNAVASISKRIEGNPDFLSASILSLAHAPDNAIIPVVTTTIPALSMAAFVVMPPGEITIVSGSVGYFGVGGLIDLYIEWQASELKKQLEKKIGKEIEINDPMFDSFGRTDPLPDYLELYKENNDMVGYIKVGNTKVDYPVLQATNNEFYLDHDFYKYRSSDGAIFADYRNRFDGLDISDNTVLYGHNVSTGNYFATLTNYHRKTVDGSLSFYKENPVIQFNTMFEKSDWKVFGVVLFNTQEEYGEVYEYWNKLEFADKNDFNNYITDITNRSVLSTDVDLQYGDKLLTLSTPYWPYGREIDTRCVVFARKVRVGESSYVDVNKATNNVNVLRFAEESRQTDNSEEQHFIVVAGSFANRENAEEAATSVNSIGFTSYVEWSTEFQVYRVIAGKFLK